jgi:hypothetical protein
VKNELANALEAASSQAPLVTEVYEAIAGDEYSVPDLSPDGVRLWLGLWRVKSTVCRNITG